MPAAKWEDCAERALEQAQEESVQLNLKCPANALLFHFLDNYRKSADEGQNGDPSTGFFGRTLAKAAKSVADCPVRIWGERQATELSGVGQTTAHLIRRLFGKFPPPEPDDAEKAAFDAWKAASKASATAKPKRSKNAGRASEPGAGTSQSDGGKGQKRTAAAEEVAPSAVKRVKITATGLSTRPPIGPGPSGHVVIVPSLQPNAQASARSLPKPASASAAGAGASCSAAGPAGSAGDASAAAPGGRAKRPYRTHLGTAASAILVVLYVHHCRGQDVMTKDEICRAAEMTGIHKTSFYTQAVVNGGPIDPRQRYTAWSCMKTLLNATPPVVLKQGRSNFKLLPEGEGLAREMYLDALRLGQVEPLSEQDLRQAVAKAARGGEGRGGFEGGGEEWEELGRRAAGGAGPAGTAKGERGGPALIDVDGSDSDCGVGGRAAARDSGGNGAITLDSDSEDEPLPLRERLALRAGMTVAAAGAPAARATRPAGEHGTGTASTSKVPGHGTVTPGRARRGADAGTAAGPGKQRGRAGAKAPVLPTPMLPPTPSPGSLPKPGASGLTPIDVRGRARDALLPDTLPAAPSQPAAVQPAAVPHCPIPAPALGAPFAFPKLDEAAAAPSVHWPGAGGALSAAPRGNAAPEVAGVVQRQQLQRAERSEDADLSAAGPMGNVFSGWALPAVGDPNNTRLPPLRPGQRFADRYDIVLLIDIRERFGPSGGQDSGDEDGEHTQGGEQAARGGRGWGRVHEHLSTLGVKCESRLLISGDDTWVARSKTNPTEEYVLDRLVERKRIQDLCHSTITGHLTKQKYMMRCTGLRFLYLLVEGDPYECQLGSRGAPAAQSDVRRMLTTIARSEVLDGLSVVRTASLPETVRWYASVTRELEELYAGLTGTSNTTAETLPRLRDVEDRIRNAAAMTVGKVWLHALCQVSGVSLETASKVAAVYPTPASLFKAAQGAAREARRAGQDARAVLEGLVCRTVAGVPRPGGKNIMRELILPGWDCSI